MGKNWLSIRVELVTVDDQPLWRPPGRLFAVGRRHTYAQLAEAIDGAFARWRGGSLHQFDLADGNRIGIPEWGGSDDVADDRVTRLSGLRLRDQFTYRSRPFLYAGRPWVHRCTVGQHRIDPVEEVGMEADGPLPYFGWGDLPDSDGVQRQPKPVVVAASARRVPDLPVALRLRQPTPHPT